MALCPALGATQIDLELPRRTDPWARATSRQLRLTTHTSGALIGVSATSSAHAERFPDVRSMPSLVGLMARYDQRPVSLEIPKITPR